MLDYFRLKISLIGTFSKGTSPFDWAKISLHIPSFAVQFSYCECRKTKVVGDKFVNNKTKSVWIDFMLPGGDPDADKKMDIYGKTCKYSRLDPGDYVVNIDNTYCVNFRLED